MIQVIYHKPSLPYIYLSYILFKGWIKTFEQYYEQKTKNIFNNMLEKLTDNRKFIWAEISFLSLWWENASQNSKETLKR